MQTTEQWADSQAGHLPLQLQTEGGKDRGQINLLRTGKVFFCPEALQVWFQAMQKNPVTAYSCIFFFIVLTQIPGVVAGADD